MRVAFRRRMAWHGRARVAFWRRLPSDAAAKAAASPDRPTTECDRHHIARAFGFGLVGFVGVGVPVHMLVHLHVHVGL